MTAERALYIASLPYLDVGEAAELLRISTKQVYRLAKAGLLPAVGLGRRLVFTRQAIDDFMRDPTRHTITPMTREARTVLNAN
jgi:excisionase family DNA binding protein